MHKTIAHALHAGPGYGGTVSQIPPSSLSNRVAEDGRLLGALVAQKLSQFNAFIVIAGLLRCFVCDR